MNTILEYLDSLTDPTQKQKMQQALDWTQATFPQLSPRIAWSAPHFTFEGTFIISFSHTKENLAVSPEYKALKQFGARFDEKGLKWSKMIVRFPWKQDVDFDLLRDLIEYNLMDKKGCKTYWRAKEDWADKNV